VDLIYSNAEKASFEFAKSWAKFDVSLNI